MKKLIRLIRIIIFSLLAIIILVVGILSFLYSPRYVYRLAKYNVADVYDYIHFENREIQAADSAFSFPLSIDEPLVESLFHEKVEAYGFTSLNEWAEKSLTTALIVIRRDTLIYEKYFNGFSRDSYFHSQSMAKSFISTLIGLAIEDGYIKSVEDPMTAYIPELLERDARFGKLFLNEGNWNYEQLIPKEWIRESTLEDTTISRDKYPEWMGSGDRRTYYKYHWWGHVSNDSSYQFFASGNLGQEIYIIPREETIIVHCGNSLEYYNADVLWSASERIY